MSASEVDVAGGQAGTAERTAQRTWVNTILCGPVPRPTLRGSVAGPAPECDPGRRCCGV